MQVWKVLIFWKRNFIRSFPAKTELIFSGSKPKENFLVNVGAFNNLKSKLLVIEGIYYTLNLKLVASHFKNHFLICQYFLFNFNKSASCASNILEIKDSVLKYNFCMEATYTFLDD